MVDFDVFLAHNSDDKPQVQDINKELKNRGLKTWLDRERISGNKPLFKEIEEGISQSKSAVFFVGLNESGKWQENFELPIIIDSVIYSGIKLIPVLLPGVQQIPNKAPYLFLRTRFWIKFRSINDATALDNLENSIRNFEKVAIKYDAVNLRTERNVDYTKLRDFLAKQKWKEADKETSKVMLLATGKREYDYLTYQNIDNFSCVDLMTIDNLWITYSNSHFGFSIQSKIYENLGGTISEQNMIREKNFQKKSHEYLKKVVWLKDELFHGRDVWRSVDELIYSLKSPKGHLPYLYLQLYKANYESSERRPLIVYNRMYLSSRPLSFLEATIINLGILKETVTDILKTLGKYFFGVSWSRTQLLIKLFSRLKFCELQDMETSGN